MSHFDDLPKRDRNHSIEANAISAFERRVLESEVFFPQGADRKDYGTDCQIEVVDQDRAANVRIHVQLKGTERALNADGSISIEVSRANLNYLMMQPYSFYVCHHAPTDSLRICPADTVLRQYEHGGKNWTEQQTLTISFLEELTVERLRSLAALARLGATSSRDRRTGQISANAKEVPNILRRSVPEVHVPDDRQTAMELLEKLYEKGADDIISAGFDKFAAVLNANDDAMGACYMAEINLGMAGRSQSPDRIKTAIIHFRAKLEGGRYQPGSLYYTIGNAYSALDNEEEAKSAYMAALSDKDFMAAPGLAAQAFKNLGTSIERLGSQEEAVAHYREALRLSPNLPEAHNALGNYYLRVGWYEDALAHFDQVVFTERQLQKTSAVAGWRVNALFNLNDGRAAFREIATLLSAADNEPWIWPWCARQVASFGRTTVENARQALAFWQRYLTAHPDVSAARRELLLASFYLRGQGQDIGQTYAAFREEFDLHIARIDDNDAALPWDRLGHWAQEEGDWHEAERCFRKAFELAGGHYGYCLGTALNFIDRFDESLPILLAQAEAIQPDAMSWFQVASAYSNLDRPAEAIEAYRKSLALNPDYDLAMFNLGGVHWNSGDRLEAEKVWRRAVERFPDHELAAQAQLMMALPFSGDHRSDGEGP